MSQIPAIRDAIVALLKSVPEMGVVHPYERYAATRDALKAMYVTEVAGTSQLRGWFVRRQASRARRMAPGKTHVTSTWEIVGYMALADIAATELQMDALLCALNEAYERDPRLNNTVRYQTDADPAGPVLKDAGPLMFAGVLCHGANLELITEHVEIDPTVTCN